MNLILAALFFFNTQLHPIHVSVTDIEYDEERKALECVSKIFLDDLQLHLRQVGNDPWLEIGRLSKEELDQHMSSFIKKNAQFKINDKAMEVEYVGHELMFESIKVYYQVPKVKRMTSFEMKNTFLLTLYDDQVNMVHVTVEGKMRSMRTTPEEPSYRLDYD